MSSDLEELIAVTRQNSENFGQLIELVRRSDARQELLMQQMSTLTAQMARIGDSIVRNEEIASSRTTSAVGRVTTHFDLAMSKEGIWWKRWAVIYVCAETITRLGLPFIQQALELLNKRAVL